MLKIIAVVLLVVVYNISNVSYAKDKTTYFKQNKDWWFTKFEGDQKIPEVKSAINIAVDFK